jgi:endonuclease YncB( thermonuclease family)
MDLRKMKIKYLAILLAMLALSPALAQKQLVSAEYDFRITRVIDGDTVAFRADFLPAPLKPELSIRIYGVDTPEKGHRAQCTKEKALEERASEFTRAAVKNSKIQRVKLMRWDKYGGRVLGDVILDGESLRAMLINQGLAREYYGDKKQSWCN